MWTGHVRWCCNKSLTQLCFVNLKQISYLDVLYWGKSFFVGITSSFSCGLTKDTLFLRWWHQPHNQSKPWELYTRIRVCQWWCQCFGVSLSLVPFLCFSHCPLLSLLSWAYFTPLLPPHTLGTQIQAHNTGGDIVSFSCYHTHTRTHTKTFSKQDLCSVLDQGPIWTRV